MKSMNKESNFFKNLPRPFIALAPMAGVTDPVFRSILADYGPPDVFWTEMVSAKGLFRGQMEELMPSLEFEEKEKPIVAQIFGSEPGYIEKAAALVEELGFDGVDLNMGCPDQSVEKQNAGAALMREPDLAVELIEAAKSGVSNIPVSVKTRLGWKRDDAEEWFLKLTSARPAAFVLHARTRAQRFGGEADWSRIRNIVEIRDKENLDIVIIGNGDISGADEGRGKAEGAGAEGAMIGRAALGNPWVFTNEEPAPEEKIKTAIKHAENFEKFYKGRKPFAEVRKHLAGYISGWRRAKDLRREVMKAENANELKEILSQR